MGANEGGARPPRWVKIDAPMVEESKYGRMCCIPAGKGSAKFAFGISKAKAIIKHLSYIEKFIHDEETVSLESYEMGPTMRAIDKLSSGKPLTLEESDARDKVYAKTYEGKYKKVFTPLGIEIEVPEITGNVASRAIAKITRGERITSDERALLGLHMSEEQLKTLERQLSSTEGYVSVTGGATLA